MARSLLSHVPRRLEDRFKVGRRADHVLWQTTDSVCAGTNGFSLYCRDATTVATNTAGVAAGVVAELEAAWWCKVEAREGSGTAQKMAVMVLSVA